MQVACVAGIRGGVARCRNLIPCAVHPNGQPPAPRPDVVLLKVHLNKKWNQRFALTGVPFVERTPERGAKLAAEHQARAGQLDRNPFWIREGREGIEGEMGSPYLEVPREQPGELPLYFYPEAADSGCPVFGMLGLPSVSIFGLVAELEQSEFRLTGVHRLARGWKPPIRLVLQFAREGEAAQGFPWKLYGEFIATCFGQVDVWANERDERGLVVHTVNCGERRDGQPATWRLRYAGGDWGASPAQ